MTKIDTVAKTIPGESKTQDNIPLNQRTSSSEETSNEEKTDIFNTILNRIPNTILIPIHNIILFIILYIILFLILY